LRPGSSIKYLIIREGDVKRFYDYLCHAAELSVRENAANIRSWRAEKLP
jgi:hypothetical protein